MGPARGLGGPQELGERQGGGPGGTRAGVKLTSEGLLRLTKGLGSRHLNRRLGFQPTGEGGSKPRGKSYLSRSAPQLKTLCSKLEGERCGGQ